MKLLALFLLPSLLLSCDSWCKSAIAMTAAHGADIHSSYNRQGMEANLLFGTTFSGPRDLSVKLGVVGGTIVVEKLIMKKIPKTRRFFTRLNLVVAGGIGGVAIHNYTVKETTNAQETRKETQTASSQEGSTR